MRGYNAEPPPIDVKAPHNRVIFRVRWKKLGGHYHLRVFSGTTPEGTFAKLGELALDERDWQAFMDSVAWQSGRWQFRVEDD